MNTLTGLPIRHKRSPMQLAKATGGNRELLIECGAVRSLHLGASETLRVAILSGASWITLEGDAEDHVLFAGSHRTFIGPGRLVVEALHAGTSLRFER
ncbi:MAG: hypothetical protein JWL90_3143 [Chthoniobacteraceae bacterium]|nr:hypothetical protein [Chthoniobacteraceae bacterium]